LDYLAARGLKLPTTAQKYYQQCGTRPDFVYEKQHTAIYVDGPPHDFPDRQKRDQEKTAAMEDLGITVLRFHHQDDWDAKIAAHPNIFGVAREPVADTSAAGSEPDVGLDLDLFPNQWRAVVETLAAAGDGSIEPGGDVTEAGTVLGSYVLEVLGDGQPLRVVDAGDENADRVVKALKKQGFAAVAVDPGAPDAADQIRSARGGKA
jgi:hypothetical protein